MCGHVAHALDVIHSCSQWLCCAKLCNALGDSQHVALTSYVTISYEVLCSCLQLHSIAGGLAGSIAWWSVYPLDVIKSRIQASSKAESEYKGSHQPLHMVWHYLTADGACCSDVRLHRSTHTHTELFSRWELIQLTFLIALECAIMIGALRAQCCVGLLLS